MLRREDRALDHARSSAADLEWPVTQHWDLALDAKIEAPPRADDLGTLRVRGRLAMAFLLFFLFVFAALDPWIAPQDLAKLYTLKLAQVVITLAALWVIEHAKQARIVSRAVVIAGVCGTFVTAASSLVEGENWHATAFGVSTALIGAAVMPWGVRPQAELALGVLIGALIPVLVRQDGPWAWFLIASSTPIFFSVSIAWQKQRDRERLQQRLWALYETMERLRQLTEHVDGVFWLSEPDGTLLYVSPRFEDIWGQSRATLAQNPTAWLDMVYEDDRGAVQAGMRTAADTGSWTQEYRLLRPDGLIRWIRDATTPVAGAEGVVWRIARMSLDITAEKKTAEAERMRELARTIQSAVEDERRRMARELHDELGQALTGIKLRLGTLGKAPDGSVGAPTAGVEACIREIDAAMRSVRAMIHELRPPVLDDLGLFAALRSQAESFATKTGIRCDVHMPEREPELSDDEVTTIFRVAQESLTNVARHAEASCAHLRFALGTTYVALSVEDDGKGIAAAAEDFGLRGMRERAALLNGSLTVRPGLAGGTVVNLRLPRSGRRSRARTGDAADHPTLASQA